MVTQAMKTDVMRKENVRMRLTVLEADASIGEYLQIFLWCTACALLGHIVLFTYYVHMSN